MVKDIPSIPMFARPLYTIHAKKVKGPVGQPDAGRFALEHLRVDDSVVPAALASVI